MNPIEKHNEIEFCFFIPGEKKQILPGSYLWELPLSGKKSGSLRNFNITTGDYFTACCSFLSKNDFLKLRTGLELFLQRPVLRDQIDKINVSLEKHGAFYHPLKVQVVGNNKQNCFFVLNGAVSNPGLSLIEKESDLISRLNKTCSKLYLPKIYGMDFIQTDKGRLGFFLGQWFEGYKEFHVTMDNGTRQIAVWESDGRCRYISETDAGRIYHHISAILTYYYNIDTFEQISPWHHAAGDFVVKQEEKEFDVRLITVRGYSPFMEPAKGTDQAKMILPFLLFFFLNLTLRIRLDRINGTGETVLLGETVTQAAIQGFFTELDYKSKIYDYGELRSIFIDFFQRFTFEQIIEIMENILEDSYPEFSEKKLLKKNLSSHGTFLYSFLKNL